MLISQDHHLPEVLLQHTCLLGEGPVWDVNTKTIIWIDLLNGIIHELYTQEQSHRTLELGDVVGAVVLTQSGNYLAALKSGLSIVDRSTGEIHFVHHPEQHLPSNRFNDGKCDPNGRFWVGTMSISEEPGAGSMYMLDSSMTISKKFEGVTISNGLTWSADYKTFYYIDTPTYQVVAYDYDRMSGNISNKRIVIRIPTSEGYPDGMTIDTDGMLWIAHWDGSQVARWDPFSGKKIFSILLPVERITSCTFGGDDLRDLYITTARVGLTEKQLSEQPLAGSLFVVKKSGFQGFSAIKFDDSNFKIV